MKKMMTLQDMDAVIDNASGQAQVVDAKGYPVQVLNPKDWEITKAFCFAKRLIIVVAKVKGGKDV